MKIAYFDCIAGASGDMILGALIDAGLEADLLRERLDALHLPGFALEVRRVQKLGFGATHVRVRVEDDVPARHLAEIERLVAESDVAPELRERARAIFRRIGEAEAGIHGTEVEHVHLHELGGVDTIVDVVGALVGLDALGIAEVHASPLPLGRGFVRGAHGQIPLPAPATVALLKGVPVVGSPVEMETVTPTGAALLSSLAASFGPIPAMTLEAVGYGAGSRDLPIPNVLRLLVGERDARAPRKAAHEHHHPTEDHPHEHPHAGEHAPGATRMIVLETNVDDMNPEFYGYLMDRLFAAGALDVFYAPIQMKKNRPATLLRALCAPEHAEALRAILFAETTTLGVRAHPVERHCLPRTLEQVETEYGTVRVKVAQLPGGAKKAAPEYEDCRRLAEEKGVPLREVYRAAERGIG